MSRRKKALLSVWDKTPQFDRLVRALLKADYELMASGGTCKHIDKELGFDVTDVEKITEFGAALDHRVVTLAAPIHGGLLADERLHMEELARLDWPFIDVVVGTFYPLEETIKKVSAKYIGVTDLEELEKKWAEINNMVDIGGPTLIRSACKGGRIVVAEEDKFKYLVDRLESGDEISLRDRLLFQADAIDTVSEYLKIEARFRADRFKSVNG